MKLKTEHIPYMILAGFLCIWLCIALIVIPHIYGPIFLLDEFGYWTHAAHMAGMDWKEAISQSTWYSFGYGLLMLPFMKLIANPVTLYRCMAGVNFLLSGISALLVYKVLKEIFDGMDGKLAAVISGISTLYVAYITYAQTTLAESLLTFLYVLLAYGLYRWFVRRDIWSGLPVMLAAGYMYMVHMRTVGILLATAACMTAAPVFQFWKEKHDSHERHKEYEKHDSRDNHEEQRNHEEHDNPEKRAKYKNIMIILSVAAITALILIFTGIIKKNLINGIASERYGSAAGANGYSGQWGKFRYLCTLDGMYRFLTGVAGKVFYLGCASFGLYYWGMSFLLKKAKNLFTCIINKRDCTGKDWLYLWFLLSHAAAFLITSVAWIYAGRLDGLLYGRYHENTIPFIMAFGAVELLTNQEFKKKVFRLAGLMGAGVVLVSILADVDGMEYMNNCHITGIIYATVFADRYSKRTLMFAYVIGGLGSILVMRLVRMTDGGRRRIGLLAGVSLMQLILAFYAWKYYTLAANVNRKEDAELLRQAKQMIDASGEDEALYLYNGNEMWVYLAQYMMQDVSLHLASREEVREADRDVFVITINGDEMSGELSLYYTEMSESPHFRVYYNESR